MRRHKSKGDIFFWHPTKKKIIAWSTEAENNFLILLHDEHPCATIRELKEILADRTKYIFLPGENAVLDAYIAAGLGEYVPEWGVHEFPPDVDWTDNERTFSQKCMEIAWGRDTKTTHKELRDIYHGRKPKKEEKDDSHMDT